MFQYPESALSAFPSSPVTRYDLNKQAIILAKSLDREPTEHEQWILSQYSGWGDTQVRKRGFDWQGQCIDPELREVLTLEEVRAIAKSALNAHYTGLDVVRSMWAIAERVLPSYNGNVSHSWDAGGSGPIDGRAEQLTKGEDHVTRWILEPSCGSGVFFGTIPHNLLSSNLVGVELDPLTALITSKLYPEATIKQCGLEQASLPAGSFDLIIGNVPFGNYGVVDPALKFSFLKSSIHDYFIAKSITLLKPNGHAILITSRYTLDKQDSSVREWLSKQAELLLAVRLPETAFQESAGTDVVTDILVLRRRPIAAAKPEEWVATVEKISEEGGREIGRAHVSAYYELHPEHLLGSYCRGRMQAGFSISLKPRPEGTLAEHLQAAMAGLSPPLSISSGQAPTQSAGPALNEACLLARRVFDRAKELLQAQTKGQPTETPRRRLTSAYDGYKARFGTFLSAAKTKQAHVLDAVRGEGWFAFLQALEDSNGNKSRLFFQDTVTGATRVDGGLKLGDALHVCLDRIGKLDLAELGRLTGAEEGAVRAGLVADGLAFLDPSSSNWLPAAEYLSGNVRAKLQQAKDAAALDPQFERNVQALEAAQPEPLGPSEIKVSFGAGWVPAEIYVGFLRSLFPGATWGIKVTRIEPTATWIVEVTNPYIRSSAENRDIYGTRRMEAIEIIQEGMNLKIPAIYDEVEDESGNVVRVRNVQETAAVQGKLLDIRARWDSWVFADETRTNELCSIYNTKFNGFRLRQYSGDYLTFPGLALEVDGKPYQLRKHQRSGVARILSQSEYDNSAFPVYPPGYGKTDTAICGVVKAVQLGLVAKVCIVVPKHTLGQWRERFNKLYPGLSDELLAATDDSFQNRKRFLSRIVSGGYRYVLITFEQFRTIPLSAETFNKYLGAEIEELRDYLNDVTAKSVEAKALQKEFKKREKALAKFETKYKEKWEALTKDGEAPVTWEECGFSALVTDEIQAMKRDIVMSKMENIAGLPRGESQRAFDARVKAHWILSNNGKVIGLTGTPLTNTLAEAYVWLRFCQPRLLKHLGLWHFDSWSSTFAEPFTAIEMDSVGQFRQQTRLRFQNIPELLTLLSECWDRAPEAPEVKKPEIVGGQMRVVEVPGSDGLIEYTKKLADRAELVRARKIDPKDDNMLVITSDGRKASLFNGDPALGFVSGVRTKADALVDEVWRYYRESYAELGTQIIFCDLYTPKVVDTGDDEGTQEDLMTEGERFAAFGIYGVIKSKLVERGIMAGEIEFAHDARNDAERLAQHDRMNRGRCRVIIGSTGKMGTGVNVQDVVYAVHHLDCPWRPDELEQRTARGVRDGNKWPAVHVLCYVTQRSYDPVVWQLIEHKSRMVAQIMSGKLTSRMTDDIGTLVLTAGMAKAIALGDARVVDKIRIETELTMLERQWKSWNDTRLQMRYEARKIPEMIEASRKEIDEHRKVVEILAGAGGFNCALREVGGDRLEVQSSAQTASEHVRKLANLLGRTIRTRPVWIGTLNGLGLYLENWHGTLTLVARVSGGTAGYRVQGLTYQNARSIEQLLAEFSHVEATVRRLEAGIKVQESRLRTAEGELARSWGGEGRANDLLDKYRLLCQDLTQNGMVDEVRFSFKF